MKPSEIRNVLEDHEVRPSKSLGQNFLTDENVAAGLWSSSKSGRRIAWWR